MCGKPIGLPAVNSAFPFCSDRCRLLDLGRWLGEEYRIPGPRAGDGAVRSGSPGAHLGAPPDGEDEGA
ncbi:MAG TPA: DNA gyrase inhibitor YacG [Anaeromyxobacteraceae bacterium]|nr:DNA gyrase inhibitor YacG [Anaeromyxobacteraceae bacterium]